VVLFNSIGLLSIIEFEGLQCKMIQKSSILILSGF
jgi:hypothetical protein